MPLHINHLFKVKYFVLTILLSTTVISVFGKPTKLTDVFILEDAQRTMTSDDALTAWYGNKFKSLPLGGVNPGFTKSIFWLAVEIPQETTQDYLLRVGNAHINRIDLYEAHDRMPHLVTKTGDHHPFHNRPINTRLFVFPIKSSLTDTTLYLLRVDKHHESLQLNAELFSKDQYDEIKSQDQIISGVFLGIVLLIILFCLSQFLLIRDKLFLYFLCFVAFAFLWVAADKGYGFQFLWPDYPAIANRARPIFSILLGMSALVFLHSFIQIQKGSKFNKLMKIWILIGLIPLGIFLIPMQYMQFPNFILAVLVGQTIWSLLIVAIILFVVVSESLKGNKSAGFYLLSIIVLLIFSTTELLIHSGSTEVYGNYFSQFGIQTGLAFQVIILTFGLAYRYNTYREERMKLLIRINDEQQEHSERLRAVQESERQKIAEQLHDDVGAMLSVVTLHISSIKEQKDHSNLQTQEKLKIASDVLHQISNTVRNLSHILMPFNFEKHGFISSIQSLVTAIDVSGKIQVEHVIIGFEELEFYNKTALLDIYRIVQELLNNILKHSEAQNAYLELIEHDDVILILIEDNGIGIRNSATKKTGKGLSNLFAKVAYFNGIIEMQNKKEGGSMVTIELPKDKLK